MAKVICGGTIVTASDTYVADILIEEDRISSIGQDLSHLTGAEIIDATGKIITPGGVDPHTHFDLDMGPAVSSDDHFTGTRAAAFGGTTTVIDFVPQTSNDILRDIDGWHKKADSKAAVDFSFHMNLSILDDKVKKDLPLLAKEGITTIKVFMAYPNLRLSDGAIFQAMRIARENGYLTMLHAEMGDVIDILIPDAIEKGRTSPEWHSLTRPAWGAVEATMRGIALAAQAGAPLYVVHMNAGGEVDMLEYAQNNGIAVMGETCPQYLFFTIEHLRRSDGAKWVCSPPMRTEVDNARLWEGLRMGIIQTVGTDHCPFFYDGTKPIQYDGEEVKLPGKEVGKNDFRKIPNGLPGIGDRLPVLWTFGVCHGKITPNQFVALTSANPARIFGLYPRKGTITPGSDADLVIWDPQKHVNYGVEVAKHRTDYNLYEGWELTGFPEKVLLRGKVIVDQGKWMGAPGSGRFIKRTPGNVTK